MTVIINVADWIEWYLNADDPDTEQAQQQYEANMRAADSIFDKLEIKRRRSAKLYNYKFGKDMFDAMFSDDNPEAKGNHNAVQRKEQTDRAPASDAEDSQAHHEDA